MEETKITKKNSLLKASKFTLHDNIRTDREFAMVNGREFRGEVVGVKRDDEGRIIASVKGEYGVVTDIHQSWLKNEKENCGERLFLFFAPTTYRQKPLPPAPPHLAIE